MMIINLDDIFEVSYFLKEFWLGDINKNKEVFRSADQFSGSITCSFRGYLDVYPIKGFLVRIDIYECSLYTFIAEEALFHHRGFPPYHYTTLCCP